ncbi:hypothetical protein [Streptomyces lomondensis]|uniref:Uncharacterized protein n=1 Tax=Streptomyces lomondensis TaxID=68229 RepID=A0ABQ2XX00_9ACTN|nr:hypothetical protein [Streptomyces lomondensis]MCF0082773.1 hypothetical protein [Streptomyces lomondensis]GGX36518.1 hypothetical protein GCM10010383_78300 [Streptomyces lomondensis]
MVATKAAPARAAESDADYEAYSTVVQLMSKGISDGILASLNKLKDPESFAAHVRDAAREEGIASDAVRDADELYDRFWTLANGVDLDLHWRSSSGVPARSAMIGESVQPSRQPVARSDGQARASIGISAFGIGVGFSW